MEIHEKFKRYFETKSLPKALGHQFCLIASPSFPYMFNFLNANAWVVNASARYLKSMMNENLGGERECKKV